MPRQRDTAAILKQLLSKPITDAGENEVLDEIVGLRDALPPADGVVVDETTDWRAVTDASLAGFCDAVEELAAVQSPGGWSPSGTNLVQTVEMVLSSVPARPVMLFPTLAAASPVGGTATVTKYRTRTGAAGVWGPWTNATQLPTGGALTASAPLERIQLEVQLSAPTAPTISRVGVYD